MSTLDKSCGVPFYQPADKAAPGPAKVRRSPDQLRYESFGYGDANTFGRSSIFVFHNPT